MTERFEKAKANTDEWNTPSYAVTFIIPYLKEGSTIWCPFDTEDSEFVKVFKEHGFNVKHSHISEGKDFFELNYDCDYIISNPPFSKRDEVFKRLIELNKPFGMISNMNGLFDSKKRYGILKDNVELLIPQGRIRFSNEELQKRSSPNFQSVYVCRNLLPSKLEFYGQVVKGE